ncbi:MAG: ATP-binding protein [Saprospiraceae bacterium]|nr:ATP-binding protein [Saprospiraceae bacterium]
MAQRCSPSNKRSSNKSNFGIITPSLDGCKHIGILLNGYVLSEIAEDKYERSSIIITSQLPVTKWHEYIGEQMVADAILDRLMHASHRIELKGDSLRKKENKSETTTVELK